MRAREERGWIAAGLDTSALDAVGVAVTFESGIRHEEMLALFQHADAFIDLRPLGFFRRRLHRELGACRVACLRHVVRGGHFLDVNRMSKTRRAQPVPCFAERIGGSARRTILLVAPADLPDFEGSRETAGTAFTIEASLFPCAEALIRHDGIHGTRRVTFPRDPDLFAGCVLCKRNR